MKQLFLILLIMITAALAAAGTAFAAPARVVLLKIDGLHPAAIERFALANIQSLRDRGAHAEEGVMLFPAHPTVGPYGDWHTTSFPNVSTLAGTAFIARRPVFLQHLLRRRGATLHAAGSASYRSLNDGFHYTLTAAATDAAVIDFAIAAFEAAGDVVFARIMLQETGNAGRIGSGKNLSGDPWAQDVFHPRAPYGRALREADRQIGRLLEALGARGQLDDTLFVVMGDGQSPHGWHLTFDREAALTPIIFAGPGIAPGRRIPYAENIDVAPTIAALLGLAPPSTDGGAGRVLRGLFAAEESVPAHPRPLATINAQIKAYAQRHAKAVLAAMEDPKMNLLLMELEHALLSEHQFFTPARIMAWREAGDLAAVIEANAWVLETLRLALEDGVYRFGDF